MKHATSTRNLAARLGAMALLGIFLWDATLLVRILTA